MCTLDIPCHARGSPTMFDTARTWRNGTPAALHHGKERRAFHILHRHARRHVPAAYMRINRRRSYDVPAVPAPYIGAVIILLI